MYTKKPMPIGTGLSISCVFSHLSVTKGMIRLSRSFRGCVLPGLREILLAKGIKRRPDAFRGMTNAATKPYQPEPDCHAGLDPAPPRYLTMPRTMLRYAIEKFPEVERRAYLAGTILR